MRKGGEPASRRSKRWMRSRVANATEQPAKPALLRIYLTHAVAKGSCALLRFRQGKNHPKREGMIPRLGDNEKRFIGFIRISPRLKGNHYELLRRVGQGSVWPF